MSKIKMNKSFLLASVFAVAMGSFVSTAYAAAPPANTGAAVAGAQTTEVKYDVFLKSYDESQKLKTIRAVRPLAGVGLEDTKTLIESVNANTPLLVKKDVSKMEAEAFRAAMEALGAVVELKEMAAAPGENQSAGGANEDGAGAGGEGNQEALPGMKDAVPGDKQAADDKGMEPVLVEGKACHGTMFPGCEDESKGCTARKTPAASSAPAADASAKKDMGTPSLEDADKLIAGEDAGKKAGKPADSDAAAAAADAATPPVEAAAPKDPSMMTAAELEAFDAGAYMAKMATEADKSPQIRALYDAVKKAPDDQAAKAALNAAVDRLNAGGEATTNK